MSEIIPKNYFDKLIGGGVVLVGTLAVFGKFIYDERKFYNEPARVEYRSIERTLSDGNIVKELDAQSVKRLRSRLEEIDKKYLIIDNSKKHDEEKPGFMLLPLGLLGAIGGGIFGSNLVLLPQYLKERRERKEKKESRT